VSSVARDVVGSTRRPLRRLASVGSLAIAILGVLACPAEEPSSGSAAPTVDSVKDEIEEARSLFARLQLDESLVVLERALAVDAKHKEGRLFKSSILMRMGRIEEAVAVLDPMLEEFPGDMDLRLRLASVLSRQGQWDAALTLFEAVPEEARVAGRQQTVAYAETLANGGRLRDAADALGSLLIEDPWFSRGYLAMAQVDSQRGHPGFAEAWSECYRKAQPLRSVQQQLQSYMPGGGQLAESYLRSKALYRCNRWFEALELLESVIASSPRYTDACLLLSRIYSDAERTAEALALLRPLPRFAVVLGAIGDVRMVAEEPEEALAAYEMARALEPDEERWHEATEAARERVAAGPAEDPLTVARRRYRTQTGGTPAGGESERYLGLARCFAEHGQPDRARALALVGMRSAPQDEAGVRLVIELFDRPEDAYVRLGATHRLARIVPDDDSILIALVEQHLALDVRLDVALRQARRLLGRERSAERLVLLARAQRAADNREGARRSLRTALELEPGHETAAELLELLVSEGALSGGAGR